MELAYVAGLFDGEGCIRVDEFHIDAGEHRPKAYFRQQLKVSVGMAHYPTIRALYDQFGGFISKDTSANRRNPNHAIRYSWGSWSEYASTFLKQIEPFLIGKKEQAQLAIRFQQHIRDCGPIFHKYHGVPPNLKKIRAYRAKLIAKMLRHKSGRFDIPKHLLKSPRRKWPYVTRLCGE